MTQQASQPNRCRCGAAITGTGAHNAKLCLDCWADVLVRIERGEPSNALAEEIGVTEHTIAIKRMMYGRDHK